MESKQFIRGKQMEENDTKKEMNKLSIFFLSLGIITSTIGLLAEYLIIFLN